MDGGVMDRINDASLRQWLAIPARIAVDEFIGAAEELEELISGLDGAIVSELATEGRERLTDRSLHREITFERSRSRSRPSDQACGPRLSPG